MDKYLQFPPPEHQPTENELEKLYDRCVGVFIWYFEGMCRQACTNLQSAWASDER